MTIGNVTINTESLSVEDLDALIKEAKRIRARKNRARELFCSFENVLSDAKDHGYAFCSRFTGEVLKATDWVLYDNDEQCLQEGEWCGT